MPSKTITKKGVKTITIKSYEQEKCHISIFLDITANGSNLPLYLIFKGKPHWNIEKELKKDKYVSSKKFFIASNSTADSTSEIIKDWKFNIWDKYLTNVGIINDENHGYLINDNE